MTRPDGKSRLDMLDWQAESFSLPDPAIPAGPTSSPASPCSPPQSSLVLSVSSETQEPGLSTRRRLNPVFVEWLMGWPPFWTSTEPTACDAEAMALWRFKLRSRLSSLLEGLDS